MDELVDGIAGREQVLPVRSRADADLGQVGDVPTRRPRDPHAFRRLAPALGLQRVGQLLEEQRSAIGHLLWRGGPVGPPRHFGSAPRDEFVAVVRLEAVHQVTFVAGPPHAGRHCAEALGLSPVGDTMKRGAECPLPVAEAMFASARNPPFRFDRIRRLPLGFHRRSPPIPIPISS